MLKTPEGSNCFRDHWFYVFLLMCLLDNPVFQGIPLVQTAGNLQEHCSTSLSDYFLGDSTNNDLTWRGVPINLYFPLLQGKAKCKVYLQSGMT